MVRSFVDSSITSASNAAKSGYVLYSDTLNSQKSSSRCSRNDPRWDASIPSSTWIAHGVLTKNFSSPKNELSAFPYSAVFAYDFADRVGYHAPGLPETWKERKLHPELTSWGQVSGINAGLTELGQVVCEVLKDDYIDWESSFEAPDDLPDFE